jgi:plasmid replication initiation protein
MATKELIRMSAEKEYKLKLNPDYYVVSANDLIKGRQKMSLRESQLLFMAIAQVVKEDKDFKTYTTTISELAAFMQIDENSLYRDLEGICTSLLQRVVKIRTSPKKWKVFQWVNSAKYENGKLTLRLSDDIKPYLLELDGYYSQTMLGTLMTFRSYYAVRLYQYLVADSGAKCDSVEEWTFTCDELRELFQIEKKEYSRNYNLIQKTIKPALTELNKSDFVYIYDYVENKAETRGNPLIGVTFKAMFFKNKEKKERFLTHTKEIVEDITGKKFNDFEQTSLIEGMPEPPIQDEKPRHKKKI